MRNWNFGVVWVNGHNLGRYWDVGADRGLYLPSVWQNQGENQITILELAGPPKGTEIQGCANMVVERTTPVFTLSSQGIGDAEYRRRGN